MADSIQFCPGCGACAVRPWSQTDTCPRCGVLYGPHYKLIRVPQDSRYAQYRTLGMLDWAAYLHLPSQPLSHFFANAYYAGRMDMAANTEESP